MKYMYIYIYIKIRLCMGKQPTCCLLLSCFMLVQTDSNQLCVLSRRSSMTWAGFNRFLHRDAFMSSAAKATCHILPSRSPARPLKEKCSAPFAVNTNERFNDTLSSCFNTPPSIYISELCWCELWEQPSGARSSVCVSFHWPLWFVSSIVSECSSSAGTYEFFLCKQWKWSVSCN